MSQHHNQVVATWEVIESYFRCKNLLRNGKRMNRFDALRVRDAYTLFILALDDLLAVEGAPPLQWPYKRLIEDLSAIDVLEVVKTFKDADDMLLAVFHGGAVVASYDDFKHRLKVSHPSSGALIAPLKRLLGLWSSDNGDCSVFRLLHTAFTFISRIRFIKCDDLKAKAREDFLKRESSFQACYTSEESGFFAEWFPDTPEMRERLYANHVGSHGPGVVAEGCGKDFVSKYKLLGHDSLTDYLDMVIGHDAVTWDRPSFSRTSRVIFVPKTALKLRTICAEPATLQWYQQGFFRILDRYISSSGLKRRIDLADQSLNRKLAKMGSITGDMVTIDLSAASDSVAYKMVREWTYNTALSPMVEACRSTHVELPDKTVIETGKFAPMGSALCFPFECLIFCSIVEAAITEMGGRYEFSLYRVYGDDIIVERCYAEAVIRRLVDNGFTVNTDKSFIRYDSHNYRESCGGEYLDGVDVTPVRLPRHFNGWSAGLSVAKDIESLVCLCNTCYGILPSVRSYVITKLLALPKHLRPLFSDDTHLIGGHIRFDQRCVGVYSPTANNYHLEKRWHSDYQRSQVRTYTTVPTDLEDDGSDGQVLLYEQLRETRDREDLTPEDRLDVRNRRFRSSRLGSRWV